MTATGDGRFTIRLPGRSILAARRNRTPGSGVAKASRSGAKTTAPRRPRKRSSRYSEYAMTRLPIPLAILITLLPGAVSGARADDIPPPPAVVSPDLTDPWLLQLQPGSVRPALTFPTLTRRNVFAPPAPGEAQRLSQPQAPSPQPVVLTIGNADDAAVSDYPIKAAFMPRVVAYASDEQPGTIIIDTPNRYLYLIMGNNQALRYGVGVGRPGFEWAGVHAITRMAEWPDWTPPPEMVRRKPGLPTHMDGGIDNPLGARALYLGSSLYRIHGSNEPWSIGQAVSSGCIRMRNQDVIDLYRRVGVGTKVIVI
jgi:lipoprotein-anchoring transpeptidase ErfK/SrfK